ncbi:uncharacterized protein LOC113160408 [Anabas testudineus]|uniref:uncharacterized protein LOC113160408 n=1 Tax=Anabas testudineus TaxID=64144 RepID=UPI000E4609B8|nr:uncharacterized protein LOC113160408 [Anabas testudineus]
MEFIEGSRGIYRPIRVLFETPIYDRVLQLCWHIRSYKSQMALMTELLRLQQENLIPSQVTTEDMINLILEKSKSTVRERLWEFELEDFDEEDAKPLLMLVWAVNVSNKMRDVEFEAQMLLKSPQALPPNFQHPKVLSVAQEYAQILREKKQEAPSFKLLCPQDVVMEVVPRVLQGFWVLPPRPLLNMPSLKLSKLSIGVTKAVLDGVSNGLPINNHQVTFSRSIRDDMVLSILTEIRQTHPHDILVNRIKSFAPVLLSEIAEVAVRQVCGMFQPQSPKVSAHLTPAAEPPVTIQVQDDFSLPVTEEKPTPSPETDSAAVQTASITPEPAEPECITEGEARDNTGAPDSAVVPALQIPPTEPVSAEPMIQPREDEIKSPEKDPDLKSTVVSGTSAPLAVPRGITEIQDRTDETTRADMEKKPKPSGPANSAVAPPFLTLDPHPAVIAALQDGFTRNLATEEPPSSPETASVVVSSPPAPEPPPAEPLDTADVQDSEDRNESLSLEEDPKPTRAPDSAMVLASPASLNLPLEPVAVVIDHSGVKRSNKNRIRRFFRWLFKPLCCCCFAQSDRLTSF